MTINKTCLIVTFNNPHTSNIPILLALYKSSFDKIFFLTHTPEEFENALKVEGNSHYFHNFFLQNLEQIHGFDYYVFIHDDVILNPFLNKSNLWSRFSIPSDAICARNIDLAPRDSPWFWVKNGGYDIVDTNPQLHDFLSGLQSTICNNYLNKVAPFHCSKYSDPEKIIAEHPIPLLFGGGANADLIFLPGQAMESLMENIALLNYPNFFVEIVVPMAILLSDWPIYLLNSNKSAPIHNPKRSPILLRLAVLVLRNRISLHPIKFGTSNPLTIKLFIKTYRIIRQFGELH